MNRLTQNHLMAQVALKTCNGVHEWRTTMLFSHVMAIYTVEMAKAILIMLWTMLMLVFYIFSFVQIAKMKSKAFSVILNLAFASYS